MNCIEQLTCNLMSDVCPSWCSILNMYFHTRYKILRIRHRGGNKHFQKCQGLRIRLSHSRRGGGFILYTGGSDCTQTVQTAHRRFRPHTYGSDRTHTVQTAHIRFRLLTDGSDRTQIVQTARRQLDSWMSLNIEDGH